MTQELISRAAALQYASAAVASATVGYVFGTKWGVFLLGLYVAAVLAYVSDLEAE